MRINQYLLQQERIELKRALANTIQKVPPEFQPKQIAHYPPDNNYEFERWLKDSITPQELLGKERTYLPILWTGYWCNNGYGTKDKHRRMLQRFIDALPRTKSYWTVVQYDDGCMVDFKDLDIKIFGMSGGRIDYPIPLLCTPHKFEFPGIKKDIFCSFVGGDTHPIRRELVKELAGKTGYHVSLKKQSLEEYCKILARSVFALCPRGYGRSSFRIMEAIHYGAIPIYVCDNGQFVLPYGLDFNCYGNLVPSADIPKISGFISLANRSTTKMNEWREVIDQHKHLFTYEGCKKKILENI